MIWNFFPTSVLHCIYYKTTMKHIFLFPIRHFSIKYISIFVFKYLSREREISAKPADGYPSDSKVPIVFSHKQKLKVHNPVQFLVLITNLWNYFIRWRIKLSKKTPYLCTNQSLINSSIPENICTVCDDSNSPICEL